MLQLVLMVVMLRLRILLLEQLLQKVVVEEQLAHQVVQIPVDLVEVAVPVVTKSLVVQLNQPKTQANLLYQIMVMLVEREEPLVLTMLLQEVVVLVVLVKVQVPPVLLEMVEMEDLSLIIHILFTVL
jgi:hypothetical protein